MIYTLRACFLVCAGQKVLLLSSHGLSFPENYHIHFPAMVGLAVEGRPIRTPNGTGPFWVHPFSCHVSGQAISSLAFCPALLAKEEAFCSNRFQRAVEPLQRPQSTAEQMCLHSSDNAGSQEGCIVSRSTGPRETCHLTTGPSHRAIRQYLEPLFPHL